MDKALEFKDLYRPFDSRSVFIRETGSVESGHILAVKGPSGSGKSTLLRMLARIISSASGDVYWEGKHWSSISPATWRRSIHYLSQKPVMFSNTVEENLRLPFSLREIKGYSSFSESLCARYLQEMDLPRELLTQNAQSLSGGEASRAALVRALLLEPAVLLLDEPTACLDSGRRRQVIEAISRWVKEKTGRAVIIVTHNYEELDKLDNVSILEMSSSKGRQNE